MLISEAIDELGHQRMLLKDKQLSEKDPVIHSIRRGSIRTLEHKIAILTEASEIMATIRKEATC